MQELDCRGLTCPQPVLKTKAGIDQGLTEVRVRVDNQAAAANVSNFLTSQGFEVESSGQGPDLLVTGRLIGPARPRPEDQAARTGPAPEEEAVKICILLGCDRIGRGDDQLGGKLMASYLSTLKEMGPALWRLILVNDAVKLAVAGADSLDSLRELEESGVSILVCGTCLTFFDLLERKAVGQTTNMLDVVTSLQVADKVVSLT